MQGKNFFFLICHLVFSLTFQLIIGDFDSNTIALDL